MITSSPSQMLRVLSVCLLLISPVLINVVSADEVTLTGLDSLRQSEEGSAGRIQSQLVTATITYYDPVSHFAFIQDGDRGAFLLLSRTEPIPPGTQVQVRANDEAADGSLTLDPGSLSVLGTSVSLPSVKSVSNHKIPRLHLSKLVCCRIKTSAQVVHVEGWDTHTVIMLNAGRGEMVPLTIPVELTEAVAEKTANWMNQTIEFEAVVGLDEDAQGRPLGTHLFTTSLDQITTRASDCKKEQFGLPSEPGFVAEDTFHITGIVTLIDDDRLVVQGQGVGTFVSTRGPLLVSTGKFVDIIASESKSAVNLHTIRLHHDQQVKPLIASSMRSLAQANSQLMNVAGAVESVETTEDSVVVLLNDGHRRFAVSVSGTLSEFAEVAIHSAHHLEAVGVCSFPDSPLFEIPAAWADSQLSCCVTTRNVDDLVVTSRHSTIPASYLTWILVPLSAMAGVFLFKWIALARNVGGIRADAKRSTSRVNSFFDCIPDAILVTSAQGGIRLMNPAAKDMFRHSRHLDHAEELFRAELKMLRQSFRETVRNAIGFGRSELNIETGSPNPRHLHLVLVKTDNSSAVCDQLLWVIRDVTEAAVLQEKMSAIQQSEVIGQLAGGLAHDFNNLLQGISGNLHVARSLKTPDEDMLQSCLTDACDAATAASELVRRLLRLNTTAAGIREQVSVSRVLDDVRGMVSGLLPEEITLSFVYPDTDIVFEGDRSVVEQALLNLCVNARDAIRDEGIIRISGEILEQSIGGQIQKAAVFTCEDSGCGMSPDVLRQVFQPFFTTKKPGHGTGLGLACTKAAIQRMGGRIEVNSQAGIGTEFRIIIGGASMAKNVVDRKQRRIPGSISGT